MSKLKWTVEIAIDKTWIEDGFNLTKERAEEMVRHELPYSYGHETSVRIISKPDKKVIDKLQGY